GFKEARQRLDPGLQALAMCVLGRDRIEGWIIENVANLLQRHAELAVEQDLLQPQQLRLAVDAVTAGRARLRPEQADLIVVMQRPDTDAGEPRELLDGVFAHVPIASGSALCGVTQRQGQAEISIQKWETGIDACLPEQKK